MPFQKGNTLYKLRKKVIISKEQRHKISETLKRKYKSGELKSHFYKGMLKEEHPNYGKKFSEETKLKISMALKGKKKSLEHRKKLSEVKKKLFKEGKLESASKYLIGKKYSLQERIKHSLACKGINKGKLNGQWKGGHWKSRANIPVWKLNNFKRKVLARDNYQCLMCNSKRKLHIHHIIQVAENPKQACNEDNGITLCKECHFLVHHKKYQTTKNMLIRALDAFIEKIDDGRINLNELKAIKLST